MRVLILGVGDAQADAIEFCREQGYEVFGCSYTNTEKAIKLLHHFSQRNIIDLRSICEYAAEQNVDAVYSVGSDIAMPTVCYVSEQLGLPHFISYRTAVICNHKHEMRETLGQDFKGNAPYIVASSKEELAAFNFYPGIIKPVDSQGQRGVCRVDSLEEAEMQFDHACEFSKEGKVILEKFLDGPEVSVNAYFHENKMVFGIVSDRISFKEYPGGIIKEHYIPSIVSPDTETKILDLCRRVAEKLGISEGPCYYQIKIVEKDPYLLEVTPRLDGCHMWRLIKEYTGIDLMHITFCHLLSGKVDLEAFKPSKESKPVQTVFMTQAPGTIVKKQEYPNALRVVWYYDEGDTVRKMNGYMEKCGYRIEYR